MTPDQEIVIVGAGFSGIGIAHELSAHGFSDYLLVETGDDFGGTWYWNRYPGVAVDIPSFSYQYSFAPRSDWSRTYAPGSELRRYAREVADRLGLRGRTRFNTTITGARFDEEHDLWHLDVDGGEQMTTRHLVDASGVLTIPKDPEIAGLQSFGGTTVHTARWDDAIDLEGKRVAVIGTGASAVQLIPEIAPIAEHLTVFQRTPIWCLPKPDAPLPGAARFALRLPGAQTAARMASHAFVEATFVIPAHWHRPLGIATKFEGRARKWIESQVDDPELREKLTPKYAVGCKRPSFHNGYLATFNRADVTLETDPIAEIVPEGVRTESGTVHEIDVLILATGFKVYDRGNMPKFPTAGVGGVDLADWWAENRHQSYEGVSLPGWPNLFLMFGPYGYNGASYFTLIEAQAHHIVRCLREARSEHATRVEVKREAMQRYFATMLKRRPRQVFWQDSCSVASSYYFDDHGDVPLRHGLTAQTYAAARRYPLSDYSYSS